MAAANSTRPDNANGAHPPKRHRMVSIPKAAQKRLEALGTLEHPRCLMCGSEHPFGIRLKFVVQNDGAVHAEFSCREILQGYPEMLHGGVISALLDAAMTNALFSVGVVAVTAELTVRFLAPVSLNRIAVVRARIDDSELHPLYTLRAELQQRRTIVARASAKFLSKEHAWGAETRSNGLSEPPLGLP